MNPSKIMDDAPDRRLRNAEVNQEACLKSGCPQIVHALCGVNIIQSLDRFHFDDDAILDEDVRNEIANQDTLIANFNPLLLSDLETDLAEIVDQGIFIYLLEESSSQRVADLMNAADNLFGYLIEH